MVAIHYVWMATIFIGTCVSVVKINVKDYKISSFLKIFLYKVQTFYCFWMS